MRDSIWSWHAKQLTQYWNAFNGRKLIVVAFDDRTEQPDIVQRVLHLPGAELIVTQNDPQLGEAKSFLQGMEALYSLEEQEITFYCHGKGVSYPPNPMRYRTQRWSEVMYTMNLRSTGVIERLMRDYDTIGCFRSQGDHAGSLWHFSGTYFWFKHAALFSRNWRRLFQTRFGVEGYIGGILPLQRSFCLNPEFHCNLYEDSPSTETVEGWFQDLSKAWLASDSS